MKDKSDFNILIGCEESQTIMKAFRERGFTNTFSCDIIESSGGYPECHLQMDVFDAIKLRKWDLAVFHPTCTYLTVSGAWLFYHPEDKHLPYEERRPHPKYPTRRQDQDDAAQFFMDLYNVDIPHIAVENPVGVMSTRFRKPDQIVQPWQFGHETTKTTCLWLKDLPLLQPTDIVGKGEVITAKSGNRMSAFSYYSAGNSKKRSKTFKGIGKAIADQWGDFLLEKYGINK